MKADELRAKDAAELMTQLEDLLNEKLELSLKGRGQQTKNSHRFGQIRRDIARVKTVLREKHSGAGQ